MPNCALRVTDVIERRLLVFERARHRLVHIVVPHELERRAFHRFAVECEARHHADPVAVFFSAVAGVERKTAEAVKDRPAAMHFDRQRVMRTVANHDVGTGIDGSAADVAHIGQRILTQAPMARSDNDVDVGPQ